MGIHEPSEVRRGWGPFTGRQLTVMACVAIVSIVVIIPTAAFAATGAFTSTTVTPAVLGKNSSRSVNAVGVYGYANATGNVSRYGVVGKGTGSAGVGVQGTGTRYGVYSNGPLRVATGKSLICTGCVGAAALSSAARGPRAWGHVSQAATPVVSASSNVSVSRPATGNTCVEVSGVDLTKTVPALALDFGTDETDLTHVSHVEYDGTCGTNGFRVLTFVYLLGAAGQTQANEGFTFVLP